MKPFEAVMFGCAGGVLVALVAALAILAGERSRCAESPWTNDAMRAVVIPASTPGFYRICDGPSGACVPISSLREATAAIQKGQR